METIIIKPGDAKNLTNYTVIDSKGKILYSTYKKHSKKIEVIDKSHKVIGEISQKRVQFLPSNMPKFIAKTPEFQIEINKDMENFKSVYNLYSKDLEIKENIFGENFNIQKQNQIIAKVQRIDKEFQIQIENPENIKLISFFILNLVQVLLYEKICK